MNSALGHRAPSLAEQTCRFSESEVQRADELSPINVARLLKATRHMPIGTSVSSVHEGEGLHFGSVKEFGFAFSPGCKPQAAALTSRGGWIAVNDLVQCPTPEEQRRLQNVIRKENGLCSLEEWEQRNKERFYA